MKYLLVSIFVYCLRFLYFFIKIVTKTKRKIVYLSRQSNEKSLDMKMLEKEIVSQYPNCIQVFRLRTLENNMGSMVRYVLGLLGDMYHIAGAKVAICDTYSFTVSCLRHKKELTVIQMWHAMGAVKKFGLQSVGLGEGRDETLSRAMHMHENYDFVITPSKATASFYKEAFGVNEEQIQISSLPHIDYMLDGKTKKEEFYKENPTARGKKVVLYLPTFREKESDIVSRLKETFANEPDMELLISLHPHSKVQEKEAFRIKGGLSTFDLIKIADYVITDYSACAFETAILGVPLLFYVPDYLYYVENRGLNIDLYKEMPDYTFSDAKELLDKIKSGEYNKGDLYAFCEKYVEKTKGCTKELATFVVTMAMIGEE